MKYASDSVARKIFLYVEVELGFLPVVQATTIENRVSRQGRGVNGGVIQVEELRIAPVPLCALRGEDFDGYARGMTL